MRRFSACLLALGLATLAMADDGQPGAGIEQHLRGHAASVRALIGLMNVLPADGKTRHRANGSFDERRG